MNDINTDLVKKGTLLIAVVSEIASFLGNPVYTDNTDNTFKRANTIFLGNKH